MRSLGTTTVIEVLDHRTCSTPGCGHDARFGLFTPNNPMKYVCKACTKPALDDLR